MGVVALGASSTLMAQDAAPAFPPSTPVTPAVAPPAVAPTPTATVTDTSGKTPASLAETMGTVITKQVTAAERIQKQYDDEMAKPEGKRSPAKALMLKQNIANAYKAVATLAKSDANRLKKEDRQAFLDQYEQPNREKAVAIYLELAQAAQDKKDYATAVKMFQLVLQIDPQNATALAGMKTLSDMATAKSATGTGAAGGGSSDKANDKSKSYLPNTNTSTPWHTDYGHAGNPVYGG
jgi:hypothetical protein